jgi:ATP-dependent RNA helicase RhlE
MTFEALKLHHALLKNLAAHGYKRPTPIQAEAVPHVLAGRDVLARAETGVGKTAAMVLPIADQLLREGKKGRGGRRPVRVLILVPTHELANQIADETERLTAGTGLQTLRIYAGPGMQAQAKALAQTVDILIATPGRLLDHLLEGNVNLTHATHLVLDEADRMCDMGFLPEVSRIATQISTSRQTLLFSATLPPKIKALSGELMRDAVVLEAGERAHAPETISLELHRVAAARKMNHVVRLLKERRPKRCLLFVRTRKRAERFARRLAEDGWASTVLHSDKTHAQRREALESFRAGRAPILIATDLASRGLHIESVSHVINVDVPLDPDQFIHRVGRTGRLGRKGVGITLCAPEEDEAWRRIRSLFRLEVEERMVEAPARPR